MLHQNGACDPSGNWWNYYLLCPITMPGHSNSIEGQTPIPLSVFQSNSKFYQNLDCSDSNCAQLITTKFCRPHDSNTVVIYVKFCCDQLTILWTRALQNLIQFWSWLKYHLWEERQASVNIQWNLLSSCSLKVLQWLSWVNDRVSV